MGIRGLETYLERSNAAACYPVRVIDLIHEYRSDTNSTPIIVVDGMSVMRYVYKFKDLSWICGGQLKEYEQTIKDFIDAFRNEGAELVFFFDGPHVCSKRETWIKRRLDTLEKARNLLDELSSGTSIRTLENGQFSMLPSNIRLLTMLVARHSGCKVYSSIRECDLEIAEYAFQKKCMAILAQDTDFVIFKSAKYYWSIKNFNFRHMTTYNYDRDKLASSIGIYTTELPLLASLLGNDVISFEDLKPFHNQLLYKRGEHYKKNWVNFGKLIFEVAHFIKFHVHHLNISRQTLETIAHQVFRDSSKWQLLEQSMLSYDYSSEINRRPGPPTSNNENWKNILRKAFELHSITVISSTVYGIIAQNIYSCATCLEDYRLNDLPASQTVFKPLREKLYGILLSENPEPCKIEEWVMCGPNSLDAAAYIEPKKVEVENPGLLSLWRGNTTAQWSIIEEIFNVDSLKVRSLPTHLIIPALALRYLYNNIKFLAWELCALVSSAILVQFYEVHQLTRLSLSETMKDTRPLRLYTLVTRLYSTVIFIFDGIGSPLSTQMISPSNYQDGKLFHSKYWQASQTSDISEICERKKDAVTFYERMMNFITENNQPAS
ncbi:unnamed protein product [Nezara viridula]|uniref:Constitutive coactivator of peroxisome proliferator-activated receptor gamma n=1 Tax=Nezara viridula TaxID=85310 RepID=A0A9P0HHZ3_NEZVI|nr:unnamed protein product [Nezara viridula]